jgi:nitroreductase
MSSTPTSPTSPSSPFPAHCSVRNFDEQQLSREEVERLIMIAQTASTSNFRQAYSIVWLQDQELREQVGKWSGNELQFRTCGAAFVLVVDFFRLKLACEKNDGTIFADSAENVILGCTDAAIFAERLATACELMGYNLCYIGGVRNSIVDIDEALKLPQYTFPLFGLTIGRARSDADVPGVKPRLPVQSVLHQNTYKSQEEQQGLVDAFDATTNEYYLSRPTGARDSTWSKDMASTCCRFNRPFIKDFLKTKGFTFQ